ncbi:uncharacterized protein LOC105261495 [Musca domestica]|uniref:Uncharacterized protein LOC105261495 n=1 Tax=Musca domestica TaxID=7370 RepID=A0A1I8NJ02_MUSDO|nr:uncharacterized protein LOC105261495 [Musca domestica]
MSLIGTVTMVISSLMLMIGVSKDKHSFFVPWLICSWLNVIYDILATYFMAYFEERSELYVLTTVFVIALWYPVYYQYKSLRMFKHRPVVIASSLEKVGNSMHSKNRSVIEPV